MPFAPKIRKDITRILEEHVLPTLQSRPILQLMADLPFDFSAIKHWTVQQELLPDNDKGPLQVLREWPEQHMVGSRGINISMLYEGSMHTKVGALQSHGKQANRKGFLTPPGIQVLALTAPTSLLYSNFSAREDGELFAESLNDCSRTMSLNIDRSGIIVFHSSRDGAQRVGSHHLEIHDRSILQLGTLYHEELKLNKNPTCAQTLLLAIMFRLHYNLVYKKPDISNSCWLDPIKESERPLTPTQLKHQALCKEVVDYIQTHLQLDLSLAALSAHFGVSEFHLNKVFREVYGTTIMRYVTDLRINVAKRILLQKPRERISDVATLTGFASPTSFSVVFRKYTRLTPSQYRHQAALEDREIPPV